MNLIAKFTKKSVTVEAIQFADDADTISSIHGFLGSRTTGVSYENPTSPVLKIPTLEGTMTAQVGDWIIKDGYENFFTRCDAIFEAAYERAKAEKPDTFQSRLLAETQETAARLNKLNAFMATDAFPKLTREDKDLLYSQQRVMSEYVQILGKRLERAGQQFDHATTP
jgi:hypothetical protein